MNIKIGVALFTGALIFALCGIWLDSEQCWLSALLLAVVGVGAISYPGRTA